MKKLVACVAFLLLFFSCDFNNWDDTIIHNNSGFEITFKFSNTEQMNLSAGGQATFPTKAYQHLESYSPDKRVCFTYEATNDGYTGWFQTRQSYTVKVNNAIGEKATLSADGWMDIIIDIPPGNQSNNATYQKQVYTDSPNFIITKTESSFPAVAVYNRDPDGTFNVTIQWSK
jgi:hypothetical protein